MNIGIYVNNIGDAPHMEHVATCINAGLDSKRLTDASIFYNDVGFNPHNIKCGMFNSTDVWNFSGSLVVTSLQCLQSAASIVNNIHLYYYYGWEGKVDVLQIMDTLAKHTFEVICNSEENAKEWYRITGHLPRYVCKQYTTLLDILEHHNGQRTPDGYDVCRAG